MVKSDSKARTASAAVFFNDNKSIAGFGNSLRAVFTSIRELIENALDASEKRNITPDIHMKLRKISLEEISALMDIDKSKLQKSKEDYLELSCRDNGVGVERELIPQLFGTVLAGTKYGAQQTRGRFGLGSKMVLLYSMSTLDLPIRITTRPLGSNITYRVKLLINLEKNQPIIVSDEKYEEGAPEWLDTAGTEIMVSFTGNWSQAKSYVREYFKQLAIITPYADFHISLPGDEAGVQDEIEFRRVVDDLPKPPEVVSIHPWGTDVTTFRREIENAKPKDNLVNFLHHNFMGVSEAAAEAFFTEVGVDSNKTPAELTDKEVRRIIHDGFNRALRESKEIKRKRDRVFKFDEPKGDSLSPLGADRLRKGIEKELQPAFVEALTRPAKAYEGHPFIIEVAIGYGGGVSSIATSKAVTVVDNRIIYRYANRIPLIFGAGNDVISKVLNSIKWNTYGLTRQTEPLTIAVSLVSTKIPFPETSKEYIDHVDEIEEEILLAIQQLGRKLRSFLNRSKRRQRERHRRSRFEKYAPSTIDNLLKILENADEWNSETGLQASRLISALSSGESRIARFPEPIYRPVLQENIWSDEKIIQKLTKENIWTVEHFLMTENNVIAKKLRIKGARIDEIKRTTIQAEDKKERLLEFDPEMLVNPEIERRFHTRDAEVQYPRLRKAFPRRWIRNIWDYLVTPIALLTKVQGFVEKLVEVERLKLLHIAMQEDEILPADKQLVTDLEQMMQVEFNEEPVQQNLQSYLEEPAVPTRTSVEDLLSQFEEKETVTPVEPVEKVIVQSPYAKKIVLKNLVPTLESVLKHPEIKKRRISNKIEFLLEYSHPSSPIDADVLADLLVDALKTNLMQYLEHQPDIAAVRVDQPTDWLDGYSRNALKRRSIKTVADLIAADESLLLEAREVHRQLFGEFMTQILQEQTPIKEKITSNEFEEILEAFAVIGINSLEKLASTSAIDIVGHRKSKQLVEIIISTTKQIIIQEATTKNLMTDLYTLKIFDRDLKAELQQMRVRSVHDLLITPLAKFAESTRKRVEFAKLQAGTKFSFLNTKELKNLKEAGIVCVEELLYSPHYYCSSVEDSTQLKEIYNLLIQPVTIISEELISVVDLLMDAGINSFGKFMIWPAKELSFITDIGTEWIDLVKTSVTRKDLNKVSFIELSTIQNLFEPEEYKDIIDAGLTKIEELASIDWNYNYLETDLTKNFIKLQKKVYEDVSVLAQLNTNPKQTKNLHSALDKISDAGVKTVRAFFSANPQEVSSYVTTKRASEAIDQFLQGLYGDAEGINKKDDLYKLKNVFVAAQKIKLSLAHLSEFSSDMIENLSDLGIRTIFQLVATNPKLIAKNLNLPQTKVVEMIHTSKLYPRGTPIGKYDEKGRVSSTIFFEYEGDEQFASADIQSLIDAGYNTIESIYYQTTAKTFDVYGIAWDKIAHMKSLLRSPAVLLSWKREEEILIQPEDDEQEPYKSTQIVFDTLTSGELKRLSKNKYSRVMDFLILSTKELAKILGWDEEYTKIRQQSAVLQNVGIELAELDLFRNDHIHKLNSLNIYTVEDLYFSTYEDNWDHTYLPWEPIATIKRILKLPIQFAREELGDEIVDVLENNGVNTILDLLLTGDPILEQKTGLPAERFENIKHALDFGTLVETYDKTIFFTPGLNYLESKHLNEAGIHKILDLIFSKPSEISQLIGKSTEEIKEIVDTIDRNRISEIEAEEGILIRETKVFSRAELRMIAKSGIFEINEIDTLQELMFQISEQTFIGNPDLLATVVDLQRILKLPLKKFKGFFDNDIKLLEESGLFSLDDLLFVSPENLPPNPERDTVITHASRELIDLRAFVALGKIAAVAASEEEIEGALLDAWINKDKRLNKELLDRLTSILSMPMKFTPYAKMFESLSTDEMELQLADICLAYQSGTDEPLKQIAQAISTPGALITLMQQGRTPLAILEMEPQAISALHDHGITTVETLILKDPKTLANITNMTQKFFRDIANEYNPEKYEQILFTTGIMIPRILTDDIEIIELSEMGIDFLDQVPTYSGKKHPIIDRLKSYLYGSNIYLNGYPGELELITNIGAHSVIESIVAYRTMGIDAEIVTDIIILGWRAKQQFEIPIVKQSKWLKDRNITTIQDLILYTERNPEVKLPSKIQHTVDVYAASTLFLNLDGKTLEALVFTHKCARVIDALSYPMIGQTLNSIRNEIAKFGEPILVTEVALPANVLHHFSGSLWRRFPENTTITIQDIISSPRLVDNYKGIKKSILAAARHELGIPIDRLIVNGHQLNSNRGIVRFSLLVCNLPQLYKLEKQSTTKLVKGIIEKIQIMQELEFPENEQSIYSTALGKKILGFYDLWTTTISKTDALNKSTNENAKRVIEIIKRSNAALRSVPEFSDEEIWNLWKMQIYTVSDFLLTAVKEKEANNIPQKRLKEMKQQALTLMLTNKGRNEIDTFTIVGALGLDIDTPGHIPLPLLFSERRHPLIRTLTPLNDLNFVLSQPIILCKFASAYTPQQLTHLLSIGIHTLADLIMYPENDTLIEGLQKRDQRLMTIANAYNIAREDILLDELRLPLDFLANLLGKDIYTVSKLMYHYAQPKRQKEKSILTTSLRFTGLEPDMLYQLKTIGVETIYDFFIVAPEQIEAILGMNKGWTNKQIRGFEYKEIEKKANKAFLPFKAIPQLSSKGLEKLQEMKYFSIFDLPVEMPAIISRGDQRVLTNIKFVLNSPASILLHTSEFPEEYREEIEKFGNKTISDLVLGTSTISEALENYLYSKDAEFYINLPSFVRKLNAIESIRNPEVSKLTKVGYFLFSQVAHASLENLIAAEIEEERALEILRDLNTSAANIVGLPKNIRQKIDKLKISLVYEFLDHPELKTFEIEQDLIISHPLPVVSLFDEPLSTYLTQLDITSYQELISQKFIKQIKAENENAITILKLLHQDINILSVLPTRWIGQLKRAAIQKVWQFLDKDAVALSNIVGSSAKSVLEIRNNIQLKQDLLPPVSNLILKSASLADLQFLGVTHLSDFQTELFMPSIVQQLDGINDRISTIFTNLQQEIWKSQAYWNLPLEDREKIAVMVDKSVMNLENDDFTYYKIIDSLTAGDNWKELQKLDSLPIPAEELELLAQQDIKYIEQWLYRFSKNPTEDIALPEITKYLRAPISILKGLTTKARIRSLTAKYTHIADIHIYGTQKVSKALNLSGKSAIQTIEFDEPKLYPLGIIPKNILQRLTGTHIVSWAQILGKYLTSDLSIIKGVTSNSFSLLQEIADMPIWKIHNIRDMGRKKIQLLAKDGILMLKDLLVTLPNQLMQLTKFSDEELELFFSDITRANINKISKQNEVKLNISRKVKVMDIESLAKEGIISSVQIAADMFKLPKDKALADGVKDLERIFRMDIELLDIDPMLITKMKSEGMKSIADVIIVTDSFLKKKIGMHHTVVKEIRNKLPRKRTVAKKTKNKKIVKATSKKNPAKKATGKKVTTKKTAGKKASTKKPTKSSGKKTTSGKKQPVKKKRAKSSKK